MRYIKLALSILIHKDFTGWDGEFRKGKALNPKLQIPDGDFYTLNHNLARGESSVQNT